MNRRYGLLSVAALALLTACASVGSAPPAVCPNSGVAEGDDRVCVFKPGFHCCCDPDTRVCVDRSCGEACPERAVPCSDEGPTDHVPR